MKIKKFLLGVLALIIIIVAVDVGMKKVLFPFKHEKAINKYCEEYDLDPYFVLSVIKAESKFKPDARSNKNAVGLMQITEDTAEWIAKEMNLNDYTPDKLYDEDYNIKMGCWYLNNLRNEFGDMDLVIAAYNAGRGNVNEWLNNSEYSEDGKRLSYIPYSETKNYVDKVNTYYQVYKFLYE